MSFAKLPIELIIDIIENNLYINDILNILFTSSKYYNIYPKNIIEKYCKVNRMASILYDQGYISSATFLCRKHSSFDKSSYGDVPWDWSTKQPWKNDNIEELNSIIKFFMVIDKFVHGTKIKN